MSLGNKVTSSNVVDYIMEYEGGNMTIEQMLKFFGYLIKTGRAWSLQGMYGRNASSLIESGYIDRKGRVQWKNVESDGIDIKAKMYEE